MPGQRRKARTVALQALYEVDTVDHDPEATVARLVAEQELAAEAASFSQELVSGVLRNRHRIDELIQAHAPSWPVSQLAAIDRNILRLAIFEILIDNKVPLKAAINEAVELAKAFGSDNSFRFVNGVLGSISAQTTRRTHRGEDSSRERR